MTAHLPSAGSEFLEHYGHDARLRWSAADRVAQQEFVGRQVADRQWLDWSTESAALQLLQSNLVPMTLDTAGVCEAVLLAGPIVELFDLQRLLESVVGHLRPCGRVVGIVPCLRDNSPESRLFCEASAAGLWPYRTAEELTEIVREAGMQLDLEESRFVAIPRFMEVVLKNELGFRGFRCIVGKIQEEGYDPMEVGWGEFRFVASFLESFA